jgi:hypothetical protein
MRAPGNDVAVFNILSSLPLKFGSNAKTQSRTDPWPAAIS